MTSLTAEQEEIVHFVRSGHNVLLTGQAGVGKSEVVRTLIKYFHSQNRQVAVICSSGIACQVYESGVASTVHSYYGFGTADLPWRQVVERAAANNVVREKVRKSDVLIWDEASMSSARMFDLVNSLHHHLSMDSCKERLPFAGKQIIIVGEFLQLRPVPNLFDAGDFMFRSRVFGCAVTHRLQLTKVIRQSEADKQFLAALKDIRLGLCHNDTAAFIANLKRDLPLDVNDSAVHIFF